MPNVLIVDDQQAIRKALRRFFEDTHWAECSEAVDGRDAIEKARQLNPDVILLDLSMPVMNGIEAARTLKQIKPEVPILMLTAYFGTATDLLAKESGISAVFSKDDVMPLVHRVRAVLDHAKTQVDSMSLPMFHLFTTDNRGNPVWLEAVKDLKTANRYLSQLASLNPGEYFVFNLRTQQVPIRLVSTGEPERDI